MEVKQRLYDVDDLWQLYCEKADGGLRYELIDGELIEMPGPSTLHGNVAARFGRFLDQFLDDHDLGSATIGSGYYADENRYTVLFPDVAAISYQRAPLPLPDNWRPVMPELAIEVRSRSNTMRELRDKARLYLRLGSELVWIAQPAEQSVEVWRMGSDGSFENDTLHRSDTLSGESILPGLELKLSAVFRQARATNA